VKIRFKRELEALDVEGELGVKSANGQRWSSSLALLSRVQTAIGR
jgi:hypothetical protein